MSGTDASEALIARLAEGLTPVRRLRPAWQRAAVALAAAAVVLAGLAAWHGANGAFAAGGAWLRLAGSLAVAVTGALAAAELGVPGRARAWVLAPLPGLMVWMAGVGAGCWHWSAAGPVAGSEVVACLGTVLLTGLVSGVAWALLLRRAAPLDGWATLAAAVSAAGCAGFALTLLHPVDASAMVLAWNGAVLVLGAGAARALQAAADRADRTLA